LSILLPLDARRGITPPQVALGLARWRTGTWSLGATISGLLAGLVGITGPSGVVGPGSAAVVGAVSGAVYYGAVRLLDAACVDDPVEAVAIHAFPGAFGRAEFNR
jgi:Amt family ammonium transporter